MPRIPRNPAVRRCLFKEDIDEAQVDNLANILQESIARDREEKKKKWNFDFENEVPLNGTYEWYPCTGKVDWVGVKSDAFIDKEQESFIPMKMENEATPTVKEQTKVLKVKKRKLTSGFDGKVIRRKISFD